MAKYYVKTMFIGYKWSTPILLKSTNDANAKIEAQTIVGNIANCIGYTTYKKVGNKKTYIN